MKVHEGKTSANLEISETKKKKQAENETGVIFTCDFETNTPKYTFKCKIFPSHKVHENSRFSLISVLPHVSINILK